MFSWVGKMVSLSLNFSAAFKNSFFFPPPPVPTLTISSMDSQKMKAFWPLLLVLCLSLFTPSFFILVSYVFLHLSSSIFFPCLAFLFFLHVKKYLPLIFIYIFLFSRNDFKTDFYSPPETLSLFLPLFLLQFLFPRAAVCSFPSPGWSPSTDLGASETLFRWWDLSGDTAGEVAGDTTPLALVCIGSVFFQSLQIVEWSFYQGSASALSTAQG